MTSHNIPLPPLSKLLSRLSSAAAFFGAATLMSLALAQGGASLQLPAPEPYVSVAEILPLPEFIPGAGALYIDPANAPVGPWLSYGKDGNLVEILFMVPVSAMQAAENWDDLAAGLIAELGVTIDHVDLSYNGGHPGMAEPHYHIRLVLMDSEAQNVALNP